MINRQLLPRVKTLSALFGMVCLALAAAGFFAYSDQTNAQAQVVVKAWQIDFHGGTGGAFGSANPVVSQHDLGYGSVWNAFEIEATNAQVFANPPTNHNAVTNPTLNNLADSTGGTTTVSMAFNANVSAYNSSVNANQGVSGFYSMVGDHWFFGGQGRDDATLNWTISNLPPGEYELTAYSNPTEHVPPRDFSMTVGNTTVNINPTGFIGGLSTDESLEGTISNIIVSDGTITGQFGTIGGDPSLAGLVVKQTTSITETTALDDIGTMHYNSKYRIPVLANDVISGDVSLATVSLVSLPASGSAVLNGDDTVLYEHTTGTPATDSFDYLITDSMGNTSTGTAIINFTTDARIANTTINMPLTIPESGYYFEDAFAGRGDFTFKAPTSMASIPGDNQRFFIAQKDGIIWDIPDISAPTVTRNVILDLAGQLDFYVEMGIKSIALHPQFNSGSPYLYISYNYEAQTNNAQVGSVRLSRFTASGANLDTIDKNTELVLFEIDSQAQDHNIDGIRFGPDGYLYVGFGDERNPGANSQTINNELWSSIIRIDVDRQPGNLEPNPPAPGSGLTIPFTGGVARYKIPADNPYVPNGQGQVIYNGQAVNASTARTEMYITGVRNPWQFSFDTIDGVPVLWVGDVGSDGANSREKVNIFTKGDNGGWNHMEGGLTPSPEGVGAAVYSPPPAGVVFQDPEWFYSRGSGILQGASPTGGYVLKNSNYPTLQDKYIFGDWLNGHIWSLERTDTAGQPIVERIGGVPGVLAIGEDPATGDLLALSWNSEGGGLFDNDGNQQGKLFRLRYNDASNIEGLPTKLSETGIFADLTDLSPNPGVVFYEPNVTFWSDYAKKERWFSIKNLNDQFGYSEDGLWSFPSGAIFVKHFDMELTRGNPATKKRIETRVIIKNDQGMYGVSYRWNEAETEAFLVGDNGDIFDLDITETDGSQTTQTWQIPTRAQCSSCHTPNGGHVLGFDTRQLNQDSTPLAGQSGNYIELLDNANYLSGFNDSVDDLPKHYNLDDTSVSTEERVVTYLNVNCSYCHREDGGLNFAPGLSVHQMGIIGVDADKPLAADHLLVVDGDPDKSVLYNRIGALNGYSRMPPIASVLTDTAGLVVLNDWITNGISTPPPPPTATVQNQVLQTTGASSVDVSNLTFAADFTVEAWVKFPAGQTINQMDGLATNGEPIGTGQDLNFFDGKFRLYANGDQIIANTTSVADVWTHYAIVRQDGDLTIYINGQQDATADSNWNDIFVIDELASSIAGNLSGQIDEFRAWTVARTAGQISANYQTAVDPNATGLKAYYTFDHEGTSVYNYARNSYDGNLSTGVTYIQSNEPMSGGGGTPTPTPTPQPPQPGGNNALSATGVGNVDVTDISLTGDFTIESWVKFTAGQPIDQTDGLVTNGQPIATGQDLNFYAEKFRLYDAGDKIEANTSATADVWTHYAIVRENGDLSIYINGQLDATADSNWTNTFVVSEIARGIGGGLHGELDELRIWDVARTAAELSAHYNQEVSPSSSGLVAYYKFNEVGSTTTDSAGGDNNGTFGTGVSYVTSTAPFNTTPTPSNNNALAGTGLGGADVTDISLTGDFTIESWVKFTAGQPIDQTDGLVTNGQPIATGQDLNFYAEKFRLYDVDDRITANTAATADVWTHYAIVRENGDLSIYINGQLDATADSNWTNTFVVSEIASAIGGDLHGELDELRIWDVARTAAELSAHYNQEVSPSSSGLVAYYKFDESGTAVTDAAGGDNNGTLGAGLSYVASTAPLVAAPTPTPTAAPPTITPTPTAAPGSNNTLSGTGLGGADVTDISLTGDFTIESWVKFTAGQPIDQKDGLVTNGQPIATGQDLNFYQAKFRLYDADDRIAANTAATADVWTHYAIVRENGDLSIYINGQLDATADSNWTNTFVVSEIARGIGGNLHGELDELRIWDVARTSSQLLANYDQVVSPSSSGLVAYYKFDESGSAVTDSAGGDNNGTLGAGLSYVNSTAPFDASLTSTPTPEATNTPTSTNTPTPTVTTNTPTPTATNTPIPATLTPTSTPMNTPIPSACGGLVQEAEAAELSGQFIVGSNTNASGGQYVHVPNGRGNNFSRFIDANQIVFCVDVPESGIYKLKATVKSPSYGANTFWVQIDGTPSNGYKWEFPSNSRAFINDYVTNTSDVDLELNLTAGEHTIAFSLREDGAQLDKIELEQSGVTPPATPTSAPTITPPPSASPVATQTPAAGACGGLVQEAEAAELISGSFEIGASSAASNGQFVHVPNGRGSNLGRFRDNHQIVFCFDVPESGVYKLKALVNSPTYGANTFWVQIDDAPSNGHKWEFPSNSRAFITDYVTNSSGNDLVLNLTAGQHTIAFSLREDGAQLDKIELEQQP